jgi:tRNA 2-thiouridine synthesizing protein E
MRKGYIEEWSEATAVVLADKEGLKLTEMHMRILRYARDFYDCYSVDPALNDLKRDLSIKEKDFLSLFPGGLEQIAKLAGISHTPCV